MKAILEHGMKKSMIMGGSSHPWLFIEEATRKEIEKDFRSVYARLVLCKTFRYVKSKKNSLAETAPKFSVVSMQVQVQR